MIMGLGDWLKKYGDVELKAWDDFLIGVIQLKDHNKM